jgi:uncharacterized protein YegL
MSILEERVVLPANPQQPHCATVLLLDTSGSMAGAKIQQLNEGLKIFQTEISSDELASKRVDLAIVTFGNSVTVAHDFSSVEEFTPPELAAGGSTPMGEAILRAADLVAERKRQYKELGIDYFRPWIFLITDGEPTDMNPSDDLWSTVVARVHEGEAKKEHLFFAVAVEPANLDKLSQIAPANRPPVQLRGTKFKELFVWLSKSQAAVSASSVGDAVKLPAPTGWAEV